MERETNEMLRAVVALHVAVLEFKDGEEPDAALYSAELCMSKLARAIHSARAKLHVAKRGQKG